MWYYMANDVSKDPKPASLGSQTQSNSKEHSHMRTPNTSLEKSIVPTIDAMQQRATPLAGICAQCDIDHIIKDYPSKEGMSTRDFLQQPYLRLSLSKGMHAQTTSSLEEKPLNFIKVSSFGLELDMLINFQAKNVHDTLVY